MFQNDISNETMTTARHQAAEMIERGVSIEYASEHVAFVYRWLTVCDNYITAHNAKQTPRVPYTAIECEILEEMAA